MTPSKLRWGLLLIAIGVMIILCNTGNLDWDYWWELATWWPLLLIAIGIEKIFLKTKLQFISYLSPVLLILFMGYVAYDVGEDNYRYKGSFESNRWNTELDDTVERLVADITHNRQDIYINRSGTDLVSVRFDRFTRKPRIVYEVSDGVAKLDITRFGRDRNKVLVFGQRVGNDWRLRMADGIPIELKCNGDKSDVNLNLNDLMVEKISIDNDDGDIFLKVGDQSPKLDINVKGYDAECRIKIPHGVGIGVFGDNYDNYLEEFGLVKQSDGCYSEGFDDEEVKVTITLDDDLDQFTLTYY